MFWLKVSVFMNMLHMVVLALLSKPWMFWLKAAASLNMLVTDWWDFPKGKTRSVEPAVV